MGHQGSRPVQPHTFQYFNCRPYRSSQGKVVNPAAKPLEVLLLGAQAVLLAVSEKPALVDSADAGQWNSLPDPSSVVSPDYLLSVSSAKTGLLGESGYPLRSFMSTFNSFIFLPPQSTLTSVTSPTAIKLLRTDWYEQPVLVSRQEVHLWANVPTLALGTLGSWFFFLLWVSLEVIFNFWSKLDCINLETV